MTTIYKHRFWCPVCGDWELFTSTEEGGEKLCENCGSTMETGMKLGLIPEDKILEQRERYKEDQRVEFRKILDSIQNPIPDSDHIVNPYGNEPTVEVKIIEHDAGQKRVDEQIQKDRIAKREADSKEVDVYRKAGRNEKCLCGSGLKYKKCCLNRINDLKY